MERDQKELEEERGRMAIMAFCKKKLEVIEEEKKKKLEAIEEEEKEYRRFRDDYWSARKRKVDLYMKLVQDTSDAIKRFLPPV